MNTAAKIQAMATTGADTWSMARTVASCGAIPSSMLRCTASTTTMASSTTMPMESTRPNMLVMLMEKPSNGNSAMAPMTATGTVSSGINVARQFCRKMKTTKMTRPTAASSVNTTS